MTRKDYVAIARAVSGHDYLIDLTERAHQAAAAQLDDPAFDLGKYREFVDYLSDRVHERLNSGRSMDCDEYRALLAMVKITDGSQPKDFPGAMMVAQCAVQS